MSELNEAIRDTVTGNVYALTHPIDATLSRSGEAADAAAVGTALAGKMSAGVNVNGQEADEQGTILVSGEDIPVVADEDETVAEAIQGLEDRTGEDWPVSESRGAESVCGAIEALEESVAGLNGGGIKWQDGDETTIAAMIEALFPVGAVYCSTGSTAPSFYGTWTEILIPMAWDDMGSGSRSYTAGTGTGTLHFWRRTA